MGGKRGSPEERFLSQLTMVDAGYDTPCWKWRNNGGINKTTGYAQFNLGRQPVALHRWAYEQHVGPVPDGLELDHLCFNRWCVNPDHVEAVPRVINNRRAFAHNGGHPNSLKTHCPQGHAYAEHGVLYSGRRNCRICRLEQGRDYMRRRRAQQRKKQQ